MYLKADQNAKIVIESDLRVSDRLLSQMNVTSRNCCLFLANECVFPRNEQQKVYLHFLSIITLYGITEVNNDLLTCYYSKVRI